jgi:hypothetical protein
VLVISPLALSLLIAAGIALLVMLACQDAEQVTQPNTAVIAATHTLTVSGSGTGNGVVTSTPAGINCTITAGAAGTSGCTKSFTEGTKVTLVAKSAGGSAFGGWLNSSNCSGTGNCVLNMTVNRAVTALFRKGPFTVKISSGKGSGRVTSQSGLTPKIDCVITNGTPASTGCSASYPANTKLTLTATAAAGFMFDGWKNSTCGTGSCLFKIIQVQTIPVTFSAATAGNPAVEGRWEPPFSTPVVVVHSHVLRTGKVLVWGDSGGAYLYTTGGGFTAVQAKPFRIYCTGHTFLSDGRLLVMGGTSPNTRGLRFATIFNPATSAWSLAPSMDRGRYYPTATTLPDGQVLVVSGHDTALQVVKSPEVWTGSGWRRLTNDTLSIGDPFYPAMFVAPNGKVFLAGFPGTTRYLDPAGGSGWTPVADRKVADRRMGSAVMYAPGKILYAGGGGAAVNAAATDQPPTATAEVIDLNQPSPSWQLVASMHYPRRQMNATLLADGTVLVTGGTSGAHYNDQAGAVHVAERWDPATKAWTTMAQESRNRTYHSTAVLLPSGRVLSAGSGEGGGIPYSNSEFTAQLFTPPYLLNSDGSLRTRPAVTSAPSTIRYNQPFTVQSPDAASITRGTLIRVSSVTHAFNQSQLINHLTFTVSGSTLTSAGPADGKVAPPGPYILFLINGSGVPSIGKIVMVGP